MVGAAGVSTAQAVNMDEKEEPKGPSLPHSFSHSVIEHHNDGTHTIHHINRKHGYAHIQPHQDGDVRGSAADHDGMLDHMMDHIGVEEAE